MNIADCGVDKDDRPSQLLHRQGGEAVVFNVIIVAVGKPANQWMGLDGAGIVTHPRKRVDKFQQL
ncbi:MAG TPA: hypothetical protein VGC33_13460 [Acerihabitans sp.]